MKFFNEDGFYQCEGEWLETSESTTPIYSMLLDESFSSDNPDAYVFHFVDYTDAWNSWSYGIVIPDDQKFGTPSNTTWKLYDDDGFMGYVVVTDKGNAEENILLGIYDVIEACCNDREIFGVTC